MVVGVGGGGVVLCRGSLSYRGSIPPLHHYLPVCQSWPGLKAKTGSWTHTHTNTHISGSHTHTEIQNNRHIYCSTDAQALYVRGHAAQMHMLIHRDIKACTHTHRCMSTHWLYATHTHTRPRQATGHCTWLGTD